MKYHLLVFHPLASLFLYFYHVEVAENKKSSLVCRLATKVENSNFEKKSEILISSISKHWARLGLR